MLLQAVMRVEEESKNEKPYYGELWETEVIEFG